MNLLTALALNLLPLAACMQLPAANELPAALRAHINDERFGAVTSIRGLPLGVRDELQARFGGSLDIADPGSPNEAKATSPARRLVAAGCSRDHHCLVYYELAESPRSWRVALFQWRPEATLFEWGGVAPGNLTTIEDVRSATLSGLMKPATTW